LQIIIQNYDCKNDCIIFFLGLGVLNVTAQIQGIAAEKLVALNPLSIQKRTIEFEPLGGYLWS